MKLKYTYKIDIMKKNNQNGIEKNVNIIRIILNENKINYKEIYPNFFLFSKTTLKICISSYMIGNNDLITINIKNKNKPDKIIDINTRKINHIEKLYKYMYIIKKYHKIYNM